MFILGLLLGLGIVAGGLYYARNGVGKPATALKDLLNEYLNPEP